MNMQKHSAFARVVARELSPAAPPATPGSDTTKSKRPQTTRSTVKSSSATPGTPQKTTNSTNGKTVGGNGSDAISSGNVTPIVRKK